MLRILVVVSLMRSNTYSMWDWSNCQKRSFTASMGVPSTDADGGAGAAQRIGEQRQDRVCVLTSVLLYLELFIAYIFFHFLPALRLSICRIAILWDGWIDGSR